MPYPNEHSARLQQPSKFNPNTFRRTKGGTIYGRIKVPSTVSVIWGKLKGHDKPADKPIPQALRFPTSSWTAEKAKKWLKDNNVKYISFEAASGGKSSSTVDNFYEIQVTDADSFKNAINTDGKIQNILAELKSEYWVMEDHHLEQLFFEIAGQTSIPPASMDVEVKENKMVISGETAIIPIRGVLMRKLPAAFAWWGIEGTSYETIAGQVGEAMADRNIKEIVLAVDSPGGTVPGVAETAEIIREARKKKTVRAVIDDLGASGAYWLASQADRIEAVKNGMAGSIGVFSVYLDRSAMAEKLGIKVIVIKSGEHKGMGVPGAEITDSQIAAVQEIIDGIANNFIADVAAGRKIRKEMVAEWATGKLWLADKAAAIGIIDSVQNKKRNSNSKGKVMEEMTQEQIDAQIAENEKKAAEQERKKAAEAATQAERQRVKELNEAFAEDPGFAIKAAAEGWTVEKAKAEYCSVLQERLKAKEKEKETKKTSQQPVGSQPLASGDSDGGIEGDFMSEARALAAEKKISLTAAMKEIRRTRPELHEALLQKAEQGASGYIKKPLR